VRVEGEDVRGGAEDAVVREGLDVLDERHRLARGVRVAERARVGEAAELREEVGDLFRARGVRRGSGEARAVGRRAAFCSSGEGTPGPYAARSASSEEREGASTTWHESTSPHSRKKSFPRNG